MHLIRFPNQREHKRAIMALLDVPWEYVGLPGPQFVVTSEHIKALEEAKVRFEYLSRTAPNGKKAARVRS